MNIGSSLLDIGYSIALSGLGVAAPPVPGPVAGQHEEEAYGVKERVGVVSAAFRDDGYGQRIHADIARGDMEQDFRFGGIAFGLCGNERYDVAAVEAEAALRIGQVLAHLPGQQVARDAVYVPAQEWCVFRDKSAGQTGMTRPPKPG